MVRTMIKVIAQVFEAKRDRVISMVAVEVFVRIIGDNFLFPFLLYSVGTVFQSLRQFGAFGT
jgi:hypothetical protein